MNQIHNRVKAYQEGDLVYQSTRASHKDEFGKIESSLVTMGQNMEQLMKGSLDANHRLQGVMQELLAAADDNLEESGIIKRKSEQVTKKVAMQYEGTAAISAVTEQASASTQEIYSIVDEMKSNLEAMESLSRRGADSL